MGVEVIEEHDNVLLGALSIDGIFCCNCGDQLGQRCWRGQQLPNPCADRVQAKVDPGAELQHSGFPAEVARDLIRRSGNRD
jgi:hypothetical protein